MLQVIKVVAASPNFAGNGTELQLHQGIHLYKTEDILSATKMVYEDTPYFFEVDEDLSSYASVRMYFNKERVRIHCNGTQITVDTKERDGKIFHGLLGFLQIRLYLESYDGTEEVYHSEYASIMVKPGSPKVRNVEAMLHYIYDNQRDLLYATANVVNCGKNLGEKFDDFASELSFLEELADVYERNIGYFKANSRFKLEQVEVVDSIYKMQYVNEKTVRHIVEHPDLLRVGKTGIKMGKQSFLPDKTLMPQNKITWDIYENQVILGFLKKIIFDTKDLRERLSDYIAAANTRELPAGEYVPSSNLIFSNVLEVLKEYRKRTDSIYDRFVKMASIYSQILPVHEIDCSVQPKPTQIFLSVPQYNQIYTAMHKWYQKTGYDFSTEKVMLQLMDIPSIYEVYILVRLIQAILAKGYVNISDKRILYPNVSTAFYRKETNNTFTFSKENKYITLYYEPAIYNSDSAYNGINLFRNTSVSFFNSGYDTNSTRSNTGSYYVPDFLMKVEEEEQEKYLIMDAKYSSFEKVKYELTPELVYKYIFSISPTINNAKVLGLGIFNGIYKREPKQSLYDGNVVRDIHPFVELIPLSEEMSKEEIEQNMESLWRQTQ